MCSIGAGPVPGLLLHLPGRGRRAVLTRVDVAAGQLPHPPVDDEPVPPDQQHPLGGLVQHDRHRAPRQPHHVLVEDRAIGQLERRDAQPDTRILIPTRSPRIFHLVRSAPLAADPKRAPTGLDRHGGEAGPGGWRGGIGRRCRPGAGSGGRRRPPGKAEIAIGRVRCR